MPDPADLIGPLRYRGNGGEAIMGVPARDLSVEDVANLSPDARAELSAHLEAGGKLYAPPKGGQAAVSGYVPTEVSKDN